MESIADAISSTNQRRYADAVLASAVLSQDAFRVLFKAPRRYEAPPKESSSAKVMNTALTMMGIILMFLAVQAFFAMNDAKTNAMMGDYTKKVDVFTEAFSRQFININVKYLVLGPAALFALLGLLTMNIVAFVFLSAVGMAIGMRTPQFVLNSHEAARGAR